MLFIKKENVIIYYLSNKAEMKGWKPEHIMLLERLLLQQLDVVNEYFVVRASVLFANIGEALNSNGDLLDVIRAISKVELEGRYDAPKPKK
ncbi:hypothetical protein [Sphingobacterium sp. UME9]|uniref:hypothetical protein n=1 Tax=Sphingobacterium sp. UME9 TaxID=1862316 RepID=UPI0016045CB5|nr:hypothetical protein [Sphingobacterium sp. UME9]MBB1643617.1 hypothetical protein [Sphingobacterium sp. UME9]